MLKKRFSIMHLLIALCFIFIALVAGSFYFLRANISTIKSLMQITRTVNLIQTKFVGEADNDTLFAGALRGMVKELNDPYSTYLDKKEFADLSTITEGHFGGVGIVLGKKDKSLIVVAPIEDTPAYRAGIKPGDIIEAIDGKSTLGEELSDVVKLIRGEDGTTVELTVRTKGAEPRIVRIVRSEIKIKSVSGEMKEGKIGFIRINSFNEDTAKDFGVKFRELESKGMQGLVLDLRGNPGGLLQSGVGVAGYIVPKGPIVSITEKNGRTTTENSHLAAVKYPLAVLVDKGTASASEIVAGAVQDTKAGKLFGTKTYGKGVVQTVYRLSSDTAVKLTMAKYYTPNGRSIDGVGIEPDTVIEATDDTGSNQLQAALQYVAAQINGK